MRIAIALCIALLAGCAPFTQHVVPASLGERNAGFSYIPIDPLPVYSTEGWTCYDEQRKDIRKDRKFLPVLDILPDNAVRIAIKEYDSKGHLSFGASSLGAEGKRYQVVLDYINVDSTIVRFDIVRSDTGAYVARRVRKDKEAPQRPGLLFSSAAPGNTSIPVYVGVGLRLTADIQVLRGTLNLASLGAIAAGVESGRASGSLVVQTLGISGRAISSALPLPSELNQTTVQNSILALGAIKAVLFDDKNTIITPRATGIYLPFSDGSEELVNSIVSELARDTIYWFRECITPEKRSGG